MTSGSLVRAEVFSARTDGACTQLTLIAPAVAAVARPGHLLMVRVDGLTLRRPFAVASLGDGGTVGLVVAATGLAGSWLAARRAGDVLDVLGPVGRPFPLPATPATAVVAAAGYRAATMITLVRQLLAVGHQVSVVLAPAGGVLHGEVEAKRAAGSATVVPAVGDVPEAVAAAARGTGAEIVYSWLPLPATRAVTSVAQSLAVRAQVLLESPLPCGWGGCGSCLLPVRGPDGTAVFARACVDGPVVEGGRVRWDALGTAPLDMAGDAAAVPAG